MRWARFRAEALALGPGRLIRGGMPATRSPAPRQVRIAPSILSADFARLGEEVVPLACVFLAAFLGLRSGKLTDLLKRHIVPAKLLLACFFASLGAVMVIFTR